MGFQALAFKLLKEAFKLLKEGRWLFSVLFGGGLTFRSLFIYSPVVTCFILISFFAVLLVLFQYNSRWPIVTFSTVMLLVVSFTFYKSPEEQINKKYIIPTPARTIQANKRKETKKKAAVTKRISPLETTPSEETPFQKRKPPTNNKVASRRPSPPPSRKKEQEEIIPALSSPIVTDSRGVQPNSVRRPLKKRKTCRNLISARRDRYGKHLGISTRISVDRCFVRLPYKINKNGVEYTKVIGCDDFEDMFFVRTKKLQCLKRLKKSPGEKVVKKIVAFR
ncbi:MAG: hypothetical protein AAFQ92_28565, partial [Bacteroidota bacterium]